MNGTLGPVVGALLYVLLLVAGLGGLHVGLALARRRIPIAAFCAAAGLLSLVAGAAAVGAPLILHVERWPVYGTAWIVAWVVGLVAVGCASGLAWLGVVKGLALAVDLYLRRRRGAGGAPSA